MINIENGIFYKSRFLVKKSKKENGVVLSLNNPKTITYSLYDVPFGGIFVRQKKKKPPVILPEDLYTTRMHNYNQANTWSKDLLDLTYKTSKDIRDNLGFNLVVKKLRLNLLGFKKKHNFFPSDTVCGITEISEFTKGSEYLERYLERFNTRKDASGAYSPKSSEEYKNANVCKINSYRPDAVIILNNTIYNSGISNLKFAKNEYKKLKSNNNSAIDDINRSVATIHWLIVQENPFKDTNDITANVLSRAIYHAFNIKTYPLKNGVSLDFEAYYNNLDDYIKNYPNYFEHPPEMA